MIIIGILTASIIIIYGIQPSLWIYFQLFAITITLLVYGLIWSVGGRWVLISSSYIILWVWFYVFLCSSRYLIPILFGLVLYFYPVYVSLKLDGSWVSFSVYDYIAHFVCGYITTLILMDYYAIVSYEFLFWSAALSFLYGFIYELTEFLCSNYLRFWDLNYDFKNSLYDLKNHLLGSLVAIVIIMLYPI